MCQQILNFIVISAIKNKYVVRLVIVFAFDLEKNFLKIA